MTTGISLFVLSHRIYYLKDFCNLKVSDQEGRSLERYVVEAVDFFPSVFANKSCSLILNMVTIMKPLMFLERRWGSGVL
jgi:hypothetical protein